MRGTDPIYCAGHMGSVLEHERSQTNGNGSDHISVGLLSPEWNW